MAHKKGFPNSVQIWIFIILFMVVFMMAQIKSDSFCKFTNVICHTYDKAKLIFKACHLTAERRGDGYVNVHAIMKEIAREANVSIRLLRRANGWKPFLYDLNFDACKFMKNPKSNLIVSYFFNILVQFSNLNHSCPYFKDIIVDKFHLSKDLVKLPFPMGEYAVDTVWRINGELWARVNASCKTVVDMK